ncbi:uncharacterized protein LOC115738234 [Rhodamnia argentea]|uniref:Uncharacterized protein LOC115738234 n=1 Tax=Rhodamnia argentea TaxID=178133 RepID=A0ABM3HVH8_9MYRT|nr:uncharacterized protein LOC115738234 [Rhodamnia argentea]
MGDPSELPKRGVDYKASALVYKNRKKRVCGFCRFLVGLMKRLDWLNSSRSSAFLVCGRTAATVTDTVGLSLRYASPFGNILRTLGVRCGKSAELSRQESPVRVLTYRHPKVRYS